MADPASAPAAKIAIVGTGHVGSTFAYALLLSGLASEIVLINRSQEDAEGEAMDLTHAVPFGAPTQVRAGDYADCAGAAIVVLTAGAPQGGADSRLDLVEQNGKIFAEIVPEVIRHNPDPILLVASNPVDVLTYAAWTHSNLPRGRVIGSGTILDTARLRALLGHHLALDPRNVNAFVIGEHGDSQVPVWSLANIAGIPLAAFADRHGVPADQSTLDEIARQTREAGPAVADRKGATYYAVATGLLRIAEAILRDERSVLAVSTVIDVYEGIDDVALSLPSIVGRSGVHQVLELPLSDPERDALGRSANILRESTARLPSR